MAASGFGNLGVSKFIAQNHITAKLQSPWIQIGAILLPYEDDRRDLSGGNLGRSIGGTTHVA
jgi:hypothetical protein